MSAKDKVKTRFLLLSDAHTNWPQRVNDEPLPKVDALVHCGDLTKVGEIDEHEAAIALIESKIYASTSHQSSANGASPTPIEQDCFNGPNAPNPAPDFTSQSFHPLNSHKNIDIFITHGPHPHVILDTTSPSHGSQNVGCPHLLSAVSRSRSRPLLHCFGHIHEGWDSAQKSWRTIATSKSPAHPQSRSAMTHYNEFKAQQRSAAVWDDPETLYSSQRQTATVTGSGTPNDAYVDGTGIVRGEQTVCVNVSIMNVENRPVQRPWVVDLLLDRILR